MRIAGGRDRESGFTLLEVLVALVVLGLLMVGLTEGVRGGLALRHAQTQRLARTAELDAAMRLLRGVLTRLPLAPGGQTIASAAGGGFSGAPDHVSFVGLMPTGLGTTRRADMTLTVRDRNLVLSWAPHYHERALGPPPTPTPTPTQTVLLDGVARLALAYWGSPAPNEPPSWQSRWEAPTAPELIRLRLSFAKGDPRRWPDLIAAPGL